MRELEDQFTEAMFDICRRAKTEAKYPATVFLKMITDNGGVATAKTLINAVKPSDGHTALYERGRLDLTVEAVVVEDPKWHSLLTTDEVLRAERWLRDYRYEIKRRDA
jgi:hypothetical protein